MKRILSIIVLSCTLNGCWLFETQEILLTPDQVAQIESALGQLTQDNLQDWINAAELATKADIESLRKTDSGIIAELSPPIQEAGAEAGETLLNKVIDNPSYAGILAGIPAALYCIISVLNRRAKLKGDSKHA